METVSISVKNEIPVTLDIAENIGEECICAADMLEVQMNSESAKGSCADSNQKPGKEKGIGSKSVNDCTSLKIKREEEQEDLDSDSALDTSNKQVDDSGISEGIKCESDEDKETGEDKSNSDNFEEQIVTIQKKKRGRRKLWKGVLSCQWCDYCTTQKKNYDQHTMVHTGDRPYKCRYCDYTSARRSNLKVHLRRHTGEKPYKCQSCDYASCTSSGLVEHVRNRHGGEKKFSCELCDYVCSRRYKLAEHAMKHANIKPFSCDSCDFSTRRKDALVTHVRMHTGEKPYKCGLCSYGSYHLTTLKRHEAKHTCMGRYMCTCCGYAGLRLSSIRAHLLEAHREMDPLPEITELISNMIPIPKS